MLACWLVRSMEVGRLSLEMECALKQSGLCVGGNRLYSISTLRTCLGSIDEGESIVHAEMETSRSRTAGSKPF